MLNFKNIHIGQMIKERIAESEMETLSAIDIIELNQKIFLV